MFLAWSPIGDSKSPWLTWITPNLAMRSPMTDSLTEYMNATQKRMRRWLEKLPPQDRLEAFADLRESLAALATMEQRMRSDTLVELVNSHGLEAVAKSLDVTTERLSRAITG